MNLDYPHRLAPKGYFDLAFLLFIMAFFIYLFLTLLIKFWLEKRHWLIRIIAMPAWLALPVCFFVISLKFPRPMGYLIEVFLKTGVGTLMIICLAFIFFVIKLRHLFIYGITEATVAIILAAKTMYGLNNMVKPIELLSLCASAYLIVRGLDNVRNGSVQFAKWLDRLLGSPRSVT